MARPYHEARAALATCHGKEHALAPALSGIGLTVVVPQGIDTDALGTFTGEVPRAASMLETARRKARLGMEATRFPIGLASEGSFGPDPVLGIIPAACEMIHFIDDTRGIEITERLITHRTNYAALNFSDDDALEAFLLQAGFPDHALIVKCGNTLRKGITSRSALHEAIRTARAQGSCRIETDMRAHLNPTRMGEIARLAEQLAARLATPCPACAAPGFGLHEQRPGLACRGCGTPTSLIREAIHRCAACSHEEVRGRPDGVTLAEPQYCPECNP